MRVGRIDEATLEPLDRDLRSLWRSFTARGLFSYRWYWFVKDVGRGFGLFALAALALRLSEALAFGLATVALLNVMWWVHDVCHDAVFADRKRARTLAEIASMLFVGTPVLDYQYAVHRIHHGFTNVIGADQALETGPVIWDARMRGRSSPAFVAAQPWLWFLVALPLTFPLFLASAVYERAKKRDFATIGLCALRWVVVGALMRGHLALLVGPALCAAYLLALTSSLNHFHKPMSESLDKSFARSVARVTQNLESEGRIATWITGGLNYHIEHHLFATMPRRNYRRITTEIRALFDKHGLAYSTCTLPEALGFLWGALKQPATDPSMFEETAS
jgi:fatty acid desaturase